MSRLILFLGCLLTTTNLFSQEIYWINQGDYDEENYYTAAQEVTALDSNQFVLTTNWSNGNWGYQTHQNGRLTTLYTGGRKASDYFSFFNSSHRGSPSISRAYLKYNYSLTEIGQGYTDLHSSKFKYINLAENETKQFFFNGALLSYNVVKVDSSFYALVAPTQAYRPSGAINYSGIYSDTLFLLRFSDPSAAMDTIGVYRQPIKPGYTYENFLAYVEIDIAANQMQLYREDSLIQFDLSQTLPTKVEAINSNANEFLTGQHWWTGHRPKPYSLIHFQDSLEPEKTTLYLIKNTLNTDFSVEQDTLYRTVLSDVQEPRLYDGSSYFVDKNENLYYALSQEASYPSSGHNSVLYKFDRLGNLKWKQAFFTDSTFSQISSIDKSEDGTLYLAGTVYGPHTISYQKVPWHPFVMKLDKSHPANVENPLNSDLKIYPNPAQDELNIASLTPMKQIRMMDSFGKIIRDSDLHPTNYLHINTATLESGHYILNIYLGNGRVRTERVIIAR